MIHSVAVFCGSRTGNDPAYVAAARALGQGLARAGMRLVYGGGRVGLMGVTADAALDAGGEVLGVIPEFLQRREVAHERVRTMVVTPSMHVRKHGMFEAADAFVTLPGGIGTLDETIEIISWRQLGLHDKPILVCDVHGSAEPFRLALEATIRMGFADAATAKLYEFLPGVDAVLARLAELGPGPGADADRL
ncbi:MAG: TIGR00730 family Rossman fold protein [Acetobacteraceae bacterium]